MERIKELIGQFKETHDEMIKIPDLLFLFL